MFDFLRSKREAQPLPAGTVRYHYRIYGRVQCVGFRYRAQYAAQELRLTGWVENEDDGSVSMEVQGKPDVIAKLLPMIQRSDHIQINDLRTEIVSPDPTERSFRIRGYY